jgi:DNA repair exonuclease SbcCD ATPase subunit
VPEDENVKANDEATNDLLDTLTAELEETREMLANEKASSKALFESKTKLQESFHKQRQSLMKENENLLDEVKALKARVKQLESSMKEKEETSSSSTTGLSNKTGLSVVATTLMQAIGK